MEFTDAQLEERYSLLATTDLVDLLEVDALTEQARPILEKELASRGICLESLNKEKSEVAFNRGNGTVIRKSKNNIVSRLWQGEIPLVYSYWVVWFIGGIIVGLGSGIFELVVNKPSIAYLIQFPYMIFSVVAVWRSSKRYSGRVVWKNGSQIIIIVGSVFYVLIVLANMLKI